MTFCTCRRRKSSPATTELIPTSVGDDHTSVTLAESVPDLRNGLCFPESRDDGHPEPHLNENGTTDGFRNDYVNDVSDETGSWHALEKTTSRSSRPEASSQSPRSALADFGYAESAVGISKKASLQGAGLERLIFLTLSRSSNCETLTPLYVRHTLPCPRPGIAWL